MFCGKCGAKVKDGAAFCPRCGAQIGAVQQERPASSGYAAQQSESGYKPQENGQSSVRETAREYVQETARKPERETAQQPAPVRKKPAALWYALGGAGAAVLVAAGVAAGIAGYRALHKDSEGAVAESGEERQSAESISAGADGAYGEDGGQPVGADAQNLRREALQAKEQELLAQYGVLRSPQSVTSWATDGPQIEHDRSLNLTGLWSATVLDFDADGLDEMLVCAAEGDTPMLYLYDGEEAGEAAQTDAFPLTPYAEGSPLERQEFTYYYDSGEFWYEGNHCEEFLSVHAVTSGERPKIVCEYRENAGYFGDGGAPQYFWVIEYVEQELRYSGIFDYSYEAEYSSAMRYEFQDGVYIGETCDCQEWIDETTGELVTEGEYADAEAALEAFFDGYQIRTGDLIYEYPLGYDLRNVFETVLSSENDRKLCFELTTRETDSWYDNYEAYGYTFETVCRTENEWSNQAAADTGSAADTGYILPDSNTRYLTREDLAGLSAEECRIARNEIYARHGRRFKDEELQNYFNGKDWYAGTMDDVTDDMLNEYELANRDLIVAYEKEQGYR